MAILGVLLIAGVFLVPKRTLDRVFMGPGSDTTRLRDRAAEFAAALRACNPTEIHRLFNATFRSENTRVELDSAIRLWLAGRRVNRVDITHIEIHGPSGLVSSNVIFDPPADGAPPDSTIDARRVLRDFLFQTWIRTPSGWELLWLNKVLDPVAMDYGRRDTASRRQILQLALDEIITRQGMSEKTGIATGSRQVVLLSHGPSDRRIALPGKNVLWLSRDSINVLRGRADIDYYIDIQPVRVLKDVAVGTFDIVPLARGDSPPGRTRSVKLFFTRTGDKWAFADYGVGW